MPGIGLEDIEPLELPSDEEIWARQVLEVLGNYAIETSCTAIRCASNTK